MNRDELANEIELSILSYLQDLGGFDHWWDSIDHEIQGTIEQGLIDCITRHLSTGFVEAI